jgi:apolipoprotein N-acyltransferase
MSLATIWTAREWVSISLPYGGFPWSRLAQTQSDTFLAKWVYWGGLGLLTYVLAFIAASVAVVIVGKVKLRSPSMIPVFGLVLLCLTIPALTQINPGAESGTIRIGAVQGNANAGLFANPERGSILKNHLDASKELDKTTLDVVVWPENASDLSPYSDQSANRAITDFVDNQIGVGFNNNTIYSNFENNKIGNGFYYNVIDDSFNNNSIGPIPLANAGLSFNNTGICLALIIIPIAANIP